MRLEVLDIPLQQSEAEALAIGIFEGEALPRDFAGTPGAEDVKGGFKKATVLRPGKPAELICVGLGRREDFDAERARVAAAIAARQARRAGARSLAWGLPDAGEPPQSAAALVEGTVLATYRFDRFKGSSDGDDEEDEDSSIESLLLLADTGVAPEAEVARIAAEAANRARELQNLPSNVATPAFLADRAEEIAAEHESVQAEVFGRERIEQLGMGGLVAVSQGTAEDPRLIVLRHRGQGQGTPLGLVGKGVTFDSGGISIKSSEGMHEMKMDMSGAAAVIEAVAAIAELELGVDIVAVAPCTENLPSGTAIKPGDIITQHNGKTVEVINTDAEGRLILADALSYCVELGAGRIVDLATLTGGVLIALGSTYAALISNDDEWAQEVGAACERTGEIAWRLPLHPEYEELTKSKAADLTNASAKRKASTIYAGSFLGEFVGDTPWVHLDIAGTAWDTGREYWGNGATGFGVRLLIDLARRLAQKTRQPAA